MGCGGIVFSGQIYDLQGGYHSSDVGVDGSDMDSLVGVPERMRRKGLLQSSGGLSQLFWVSEEDEMDSWTTAPSWSPPESAPAGETPSVPASPSSPSPGKHQHNLIFQNIFHNFLIIFFSSPMQRGISKCAIAVNILQV
jgi:hypothetical protein